MQLNYYVMTNGNLLTEKAFRTWGISKDDYEYSLVNNSADAYQQLSYLGFTPNEKGTFNPVYRLPLTQEMIDKMRNSNLIQEIVEEPGVFGGHVYPLDGDYGWTRSDYGPVWIPKKGETIDLTLENLPIYERAIRNYEGNRLEVKDGKILINGTESDRYTFRMDYYMMLGDNRDNSADSRFWGFVPEDHIVGKPILVWLSLDKDRSLFDGGIRWNRLFRWVHPD